MYIYIYVYAYEYIYIGDYTARWQGEYDGFRYMCILDTDVFGYHRHRYDCMYIYMYTYVCVYT